MANMLDYLRWRGDLKLTADSLNDVDLLVLAQLSYVNFEPLVPNGGDMACRVHIGRACAQLAQADPQGQSIHQIGYLWAGNRQLIDLLADCPRFSPLEMAGYESILDQQAQTQFGAAAYLLPDGGAVVAFRGTDDSLAGWKEDMNLAFSDPVPAQLEAVSFLERAAQAVEGPLYPCGHSKGGNLAVYAAACAPAEVQERIARVLSFDGPGQSQTLTASAGYERVRDRLRLYVPHFSVVGMLLEHEEAYQVVASDGASLMQHNAFSWQVLGRGFVPEEAPSPESAAANRVLRQWIKGMDDQARRRFSQAVYDLLTASQASTLDQLAQSPLQAARAALRELYQMNPDEKQTFHTALNALFTLSLKGLPLPWRRGIAAGKGGPGDGPAAQTREEGKA